MDYTLPPYLQNEFYVEITPADGDCYFSSVFFSMFTFEAGQQRLKRNLNQKINNFRQEWVEITTPARKSNRKLNKVEFEKRTKAPHFLANNTLKRRK